MIQEHWNRIVPRVRKETKTRDYITFSDLGKPYLDRYFKMKGVEPTNDFDDRVLRIFDAGRVWEFIILRALTLAGILNQKQTYVEIPATTGRLRVMGFLDCTIGGFVNWEDAEKKIEQHLAEYKLSIDNEIVERKALGIIEGLRKQYPTGNIPEILVEVKSINSMAFWAHKNRDEQGNFLGYIHNKLQMFGYMKATGIKDGILLYQSKDDGVMEEMGLSLGNEEMSRLYNEDVETMSGFYLTNTQPPKEDDIVWNDKKKMYEANWRIERSPYLTLITGLEKEKWIEKTNKEVNALNLEYKWKLRAIEMGLDIKGMETPEVKKLVMAKDRLAKKLSMSEVK